MTKKILIINGPNLNLLGEREESKYGKVTLEEVKSKFKKIVKELHPDTVGKNKKNIEKLTKVLEAYKTLKEYHDNFKYSDTV